MWVDIKFLCCVVYKGCGGFGTSWHGFVYVLKDRLYTCNTFFIITANVGNIKTSNLVIVIGVVGNFIGECGACGVFTCVINSVSTGGTFAIVSQANKRCGVASACYPARVGLYAVGLAGFYMAV